jgi:hypothetical protein
VRFSAAVDAKLRARRLNLLIVAFKMIASG